MWGILNEYKAFKYKIQNLKIIQHLKNDLYRSILDIAMSNDKIFILSFEIIGFQIYYSLPLFASCPQAASMSFPRLSLNLMFMFLASRNLRKASSFFIVVKLNSV